MVKQLTPARGRKLLVVVRLVAFVKGETTHPRKGTETEIWLALYICSARNNSPPQGDGNWAVLVISWTLM